MDKKYKNSKYFYSVDPDETAPNILHYLDLHCLPFGLDITWEKKQHFFF